MSIIDPKSRLTEAVIEKNEERFGSWSGSYGEPRHIAILHGDARSDMKMVDLKSPKEEKEDIEPVYGEMFSRSEHDVEWVEPVVAIGIPYQRDIRWAFLYDGELDEVTVDDIVVQEIHAQDISPEVVCAHDEVEIVERCEGWKTVA